MRLALVIPLFTVLSCGDGRKNDPENDTIDSLPSLIEAPGDGLLQDTIAEPEIVLSKTSNVDDYANYLLKTEVALQKDPDNFCRHYFRQLDIANCYATVINPCSSFSEIYTFKAWKSGSGDAVIGMVTAYPGMSAAYEFAFYKMTEGTLSEATGALLPMDKINEHKREMSKRMREKHTVGNVEYLRFTFSSSTDDVGVDLWYSVPGIELPLFILEWKGGEFEIRKKFSKIPKSDKY